MGWAQRKRQQLRQIKKCRVDACRYRNGWEGVFVDRDNILGVRTVLQLNMYVPKKPS